MLDIQTDSFGGGRLCSPDPLHLQRSVQRTLVLRQAAHLLRLQIGACQRLASMVVFGFHSASTIAHEIVCDSEPLTGLMT
jgi:hypothetical protein